MCASLLCLSLIHIFLIVVALAIVFTAAVLRAPITSMGALCVEVQDDLGLSSAAMGLVTTLPLLAFAASALFMSALSERFGKSRDVYKRQSMLCAVFAIAS